MPFILPAGDYEAALRMAGASNFMEAFESGIDRNIRRRGQREALRQQRDLYERGLALEKERLANKALSGIEGYDRDFPAVATAGANEAALADVVTAASTQAAVDGALAEGAAAAQGVPVVQATPAQVEQAVVAATTPIPGVIPRPVSGSVPAESGWSEDDIARLTEVGFIGSNSANNMLHAARRYRASGDAATAELLERRAAMTEGGSFSDSRANARSTDLFRVTPPGPVYSPVAPPAEKPWWSGGRTYEEAFPIQDRPSVADLGPGRVVDLKSLPPEEFALATPRSQQLLTGQQKTAIEIATKLADMGRAEEAQEVLDYAGVNAKAYDDLPTVTPPLQPAPQARMTPGEQGMVSRYLRGETIDTETQRDPLIGEGTLDTAIQQLLGQGQYIDAQTLEDISGRGGQVYPDARTKEALRGGVPMPLDLFPEGDVSPDAVSDAASAAGAIGASLPGGGGSSAIQAALSAMAGGSAVEAAAKAATPSPIEAAIATGAEAKERAELVGPEVEVSTAPVEVVDEKTGKVHTVKPGEFVYGIAKSYGASPQALIKANQSLFIGKDGKARSIKTKGGKLLAGADLIFPGEKLRIPTGEGRETGGPAGPVDTREGVKEGVLAKAEKGAKSEKEVVARLEKEQAKRTSVPLNPFQAFGRDIGYTPSVGAVAYATHMAEQGDFSMINMMAGRVVKNAEIPGLFARYSNFASGARRRSKEILLEEKLAKETQANAAKQRAAMGVRTMALTQFQRAGHSLEDAQLFAGHYADLWAVDPQQARAWSTSLNAMGTELAKAEAETIKHGRKNYTGRGDRRTGVVGPDGRGDAKQVAASEKALNKLEDARRKALAPLMKARGMTEAALLEGDELTKLAADPIHGQAVLAYNQVNDRHARAYEEWKVLKYGRPEPDPDAEVGPSSADNAAEWAQSNDQVMKNVAATGKSGDWDKLEKWLASQSGVDEKEAKAIRVHFESEKRRSVKIVAALPPGGSSILGKGGSEDYMKARAASVPGLEGKRDELLSRVAILRKRAASGGTSVRGGVMGELRSVAKELERLRAEVKDITGADPGDWGKEALAVVAAIARAERAEEDAAYDYGI